MPTLTLHLTVTTPTSLGTDDWLYFIGFALAIMWLTVRAARRVRLHVSMRFSDAVSAVMGAVAAVLIFLAVAAYLLVV
ncbi:hypothetical protein SAMN05421874_105277 [Nonomuraea maritima]|uniref:Uncharacterized protein n=1 Tax=Nonomuraea maritima TaxID=683260 RepID=A0A1G8ZIT3_9ACTN|nr:hypothetical protein [Nonomuraea maritima]SDK14305.1 hypothetical protein SAMN05421874_105277 [Nonomuraea maritima]